MTLSVSTSYLRFHSPNLCGVLSAVCLICLAVLMLFELGVGDAVTAETMSGVSHALFAAFKSPVMWPDRVVKMAVSLSAALACISGITWFTCYKASAVTTSCPCGVVVGARWPGFIGRCVGGAS